jgi:hypothetical protein
LLVGAPKEEIEDVLVAWFLRVGDQFSLNQVLVEMVRLILFHVFIWLDTDNLHRIDPKHEHNLSRRLR